MSSLESLKKHTVVVADTGDLNQMKRFKPQDATTNPSLLLKASKLPEYSIIIDSAVEEAKLKGIFTKDNIKLTLELISIYFAIEILKIIPGRVSIEADAALSFDTLKTVECAKRIIDTLTQKGIDKERILIKISSTWEGIKAAELLEKDGIHCNLTLLFSLSQAIACAEAKVTLVSPFVGRIYDWYKLKLGVDAIPAQDDPGVISVKKIYKYYKANNYKTEIMGASFRNTGQIKELTGCDLLTISPKLLDELQNDSAILDKRISKNLETTITEKIDLNERDFRWMFNEDEMATIKLAEGIRNFNKDWNSLSELILSKY